MKDCCNKYRVEVRMHCAKTGFYINELYLKDCPECGSSLKEDKVKGIAIGMPLVDYCECKEPMKPMARKENGVWVYQELPCSICDKPINPRKEDTMGSGSLYLPCKSVEKISTTLSSDDYIHDPIDTRAREKINEIIEAMGL